MKSRRGFCKALAACALSNLATRARGNALAPLAPPTAYPDGRPTARLRLDAVDSGPILRHGAGPNRCDYLGMREAICFRAGDTYYLHYDGAGPQGWLACLATSKDLHHWDLKGPVLSLGAPGDRDSKSASSPWTVFDGKWWHMFEKRWHMFYVGAMNTTPPPDRIPSVPYFTLTAKSRRPDGPWIKEEQVVPFSPKPGSYYSVEASPGQVVKQGNEYLMFFSAATDRTPDGQPMPLKRTLSIARTRDLDGSWQVAPHPILPLDQQVENSALYFEPANQTWFLFTNHIGMAENREEYTESIWVYWSKSLTEWDPANRAVVLDRSNCHWSARCIGMPSVVKTPKGLALFYDATPEDTWNMKRDIGLAWLSLPLTPPA